jgi:hypothetical protein
MTAVAILLECEGLALVACHAHNIAVRSDAPSSNMSALAELLMLRTYARTPM